MSKQLNNKRSFPYWSLPLAIFAILAFIVLFGPAITWINALAIIVVGHLLVGCGGWLVSRMIEDNLQKNLSVGAGVFLLLVFVSFVLQLWTGFYTPIFELFVEIGEFGRSVAKIGLFCSAGFLVLVAIASAFFGLNWKRLADAIASQPGIENKKE